MVFAYLTLGHSTPIRGTQGSLAPPFLSIDGHV